MVRNNFYFKLWAILFLLPVFAFTSCGEKTPQELKQAAAVMRSMMKAGHLSRSAFYVAYPDGKPSDFVNYIFSDIGTAEWPPSDAWADEMVREQMRAIHKPLMPDGVAFVPLQADPQGGMQLVVKFDDEKGVVILEGYADPGQGPALSEEVKLIKVTPDPVAKVFYHSNVEMGASDSSF